MSDNRKILVVLTGGTIGSVIHNNTIDTDDKSTYILIHEYERLFGTKHCFEVQQPYNTLSENITLSVWNKLIKYLSTIELQKYKGVIITHGTDTCSYTAALLGTLYGCLDLTIPIVMVSSNYAIGTAGSNGLANFRNAVCFIEQFYVTDRIRPDVYSVYENADGVSEVFRGVELQEADTCEDQFTAYGGCVYGRMIHEKFVLNLEHVDRCQPLKAVRLGMTERGGDTVNRYFDMKHVLEHIDLSKEVLMIKGYPGLNYDYVNLDGMTGSSLQEGQYVAGKEDTQLAAVVSVMYHSATTCVKCERESNSFTAFAKRCNERGIQVYACGFKNGLEQEYASIKEMNMTKIIRIYDMSAEAAYANVLLAVNTEE